MCKATGNVGFLLVIMFSIIPAPIGCPIHNLCERIIDLCKGNGNLMTFHACIALIEFLVGLISEIMTGRISCFKGEDAIGCKMSLNGGEECLLIFAAQESLKGISGQQDELKLIPKVKRARVRFDPVDI